MKDLEGLGFRGEDLVKDLEGLGFEGWRISSMDKLRVRSFAGCFGRE